MKTVLRFLRDQHGTETVEWAIVIGIIAIGAITAAGVIGTFVSKSFSSLSTQLAATTPGPTP